MIGKRMKKYNSRLYNNGTNGTGIKLQTNNNNNQSSDSEMLSPVKNLNSNNVSLSPRGSLVDRAS